MLVRLSSTLLLAALACGLAPNRSQAQGLHYRTIPIGERAIGLGGAYTGIADDPSASYYNPAGLMAGGRFSLLGSLSSIVFVKKKVENAFESPTGNRDLSSDHTTTLPHFVGTVVKFGKKKFGDHRFAIAYSSFEVDRERFGVGFSEIEPEATTNLSLSRDYRKRYWGISFAAQVKRKLSLGISGFLANQSFWYNEDVGLALGGTLEPNGVRVNANSVTTKSSVGLNSWSFVFRLGALYRINSRWRIGVVFQPPHLPVKETGSVFRRVDADAGTESRYLLFDQGDYDTELPIPFELRAGAAFKINALTTLSVDVSVIGPVRDRTYIDPPPELSSEALSLGAYFANSTERRTTPNVGIGVEHMFGKAVVAGGLFTNISAAPNVPETANEYTPDQISMFGAALSIGIDTKGYRLTLGATGYFGRGDALSFELDTDANVAGYTRSKANVSGIVLYVAGAVSVAGKGAKEVQEKYKERKERKAAELEDDPDADPDADADADAGADTDADADADAGADAGADADADAGADADADADADTDAR